MKKSLLSSILVLSMIMTSAWAMPAHADVTEDNGTITNSPELTLTPTVETTIEPTIEPTTKPTAVPFERYTEMIDGWMMQYIIKNGEVIVEDITDESSNTSDILVLPEYIDGYPMRIIRHNITENIDVEKVIVPDTVYSINTDSFSESKIKEIVLSNNLKEIGDWAFKDSLIEKVTFPDSLKTIGEGAFYNTNLKKVHIPDKLDTLGASAFSACTQLETVYLPSKFKNSLDHTFSGCINLENVDFEGELTASMISTLKSSKFIKNYAKSSENQMLIRDGVLLVYGGEDKNVVIPEGVTEIQKACFRDMDIESVTFPSTLRYINEQAFYRTSLKELYIPANVKSIGQFAFFDIEKLTKLTIEEKQ